VRWLEDGENNLGELKERRWRQKTNNREKWESVVKEAKVFRGLWSKGVRITQGVSWS
jgi:hypothetical protein